MSSHDFEEAILLERAALELRGVGHLNRWHSLHQLTFYLCEWYDKPASVADLEEATHSTEPRWISVKVTLIMP